MCVTPTILRPANYFYAGSEPVLIPCRHCWQCRRNMVENWVGRNLAEAQTASGSYAVTFTYGRDWDGRSDHIQSAQLMYSDMQKLLKRLRFAGYKVRYIIAGEYGSALGRAHWHTVLHFYGKTPPTWDGQHLSWSQEKWDRVGGIHIPEWSQDGMPLGFVHIKRASYAHVRYALKYLLKEQYDPNKQNVFHMSRKPPLGYQYFTELAAETAAAGIALEDLCYKFTVRTQAGETKQLQFQLRGRMAEIYLETYAAAWRELRQTKWLPATELLEMWEQYGRIVNIDMADEARVNNLPNGEGMAYGVRPSLFTSDNHVKAEVTKPKLNLREWLQHRFEERKKEALEKKRKAEINGKKKRQRQLRLSYEHRFVEQSIQAGCAIACVTRQQFDALPRSWREFLVRYPGDCKSLFEREREDAAAASGRVQHLPERWRRHEGR